jgi:hypothetical protein
MHLEMKRHANSENDDMDTHTSDSEHIQKKAGEQLEMISAPSTGRMSSVPTSATDLEDDQWDCKSTGEMMGRSSEVDLCRMSAFMSTKAVPNETENHLRTYQIVYQTASQETVTEWHHERQLRQLPIEDN